MKILVINSGSSSIKYRLFTAPGLSSEADGIVERIGEPLSRVRHNVHRNGEKETYTTEMPIADHHQGLAEAVRLLRDDQWGVIADVEEVAAIGHRVVHGGERFSEPTIIGPDVRETIRRLFPLAPLHNPPNLSGIEVATELFPAATQVAVFDTAFHQTMPAHAYRYAIPDALYRESGIRAYGFHGTSHRYVSQKACEHLRQPPEQTNLITIHLGNGCSMTAVKGGRSIDTSMGFSPLPGLIMGTRSGDIDPAVFYYLGTRQEMSFQEIDRILNKQSGLLGLTGDNDLRDIERRQAEGDERAQLALDMYAYRIKKYIGAYMAALGHVDALVFTAGVGENSDYVRRHSCQGLEPLGIVIDDARNSAGPKGAVTEIQQPESKIKILIIRTNEELEIAAQTLSLLEAEER